MEIDKALQAVLREPDDCQCAFCIGAKALAREVQRLQELVYIGEHEFPELTWKERCLEDHHEVERLRDIIGTTEDGALIPDCEHFFCPKCCNELENLDMVFNTGSCWHCGNPDSFGEPPLGLFLSSCYSTQQAARTAKEKNP